MKIQAMWDDYIRMVYPQGVPQQQLDELRRAFFSGMVGMHRLLMEASADEDVNVCAKNISDLEEELFVAIGSELISLTKDMN